MADKFNKGDKVIIIHTGERGTVQEKKTIGNSIRWKVFISQQKQPLVQEDHLELVPDKGIKELFEEGEFLGLTELKRILSFIRIKGDITNIYYSMNNGSTKFYPYQFKPVLKFIESTSGRLLIADEVGLGKTIESMYIWEELKARENSQRLLIICPSALQEKWKHDLLKYFSIECEIVNAGTLLDKFATADQKPLQTNFALIASYETIRYKDKGNGSKVRSSAKKFNEFLDKRPENIPILDLIIADEAHNLRNPASAGHRTVERLRNNSKNIVLLSATPIQTSQSNLYNVLKILDPEVFYNEKTFDSQLSEGQNYIRIANNLRNNAPVGDYKILLEMIKNGELYKRNPGFIDVFEANLTQILKEPSKRSLYAEAFSQKIFYANYFTRTRKRDAIIERPVRDAVTWPYSMNSYETEIYNEVSKILSERAAGLNNFGKCQIVGRQRQMASCIVAALNSWKNKIADGFGEAFIEQNSEEYWQEDFSDFNDVTNISEIVSYLNVDVDALRENDSKYSKMLKSIRERQKEFPNAKLIIFSFYRGTISYLQERLEEDGIKVLSMMGGGNNKNEIIEKFKDDESITILLSTEVGAEGLDLQFCDTEINYDLPWNPMRLEQRIGRIDRIGQESKKINIINLFCENSVEDRVMERLYNRIQIFKDSIGDVEDILGNPTEEISRLLLSKDLTEEQKEKQADQLINTMCAQKKQQEQLEENASLFTGLQQYILQNIENSRTVERFVRPVDLSFYVKDCLENDWKGCSLVPYPSLSDAWEIKLSYEAAQAFGKFMADNGLNSQLRMANVETLCLFDASQKDKARRKSFEIITYSHPLVRWVTEQRANAPTSCYGCSSVVYKNIGKKADIPSGMYSYYIQQRRFEGFKKKNELKYYMCNVETQEIIPALKAEEILTRTFIFGNSNPQWEKDCSLDDAYDALDLIIQNAENDFIQSEGEFKQANEDTCNQQIAALEGTTARKIETLKETIEQMRLSGQDQNMINLRERQIETVQENLKNKKGDVERRRFINSDMIDVCVGLLKVE